MGKESKHLGIRDPGYDRTKEFIKYLLGDNDTYGMDIDSIYFDGEKWIVIEFLFTDIMKQNFGPHESHPHRYPWNWKKFVNLYKLSTDLKGELWLVNFAWNPLYLEHFKELDKKRDELDEEERDELDKKKEYLYQVRLMIVEDIDWDKLKKYIHARKKQRFLAYLKIKQDCKLTLEQFRDIYRALNEDSQVNFESTLPEVYTNPSPKRSPRYRGLLNKYCQKDK